VLYNYNFITFIIINILFIRSSKSCYIVFQLMKQSSNEFFNVNENINLDAKLIYILILEKELKQFY